MQASIGSRARRRVLAAILFVLLLPCLSAFAAPFAYVSNSQSDTVSIIDTATNMVKATIPAGPYPTEVAVHPDGTKVFVAQYLGDSVSVIGTLQNSLIHTITGIPQPQCMALSPSGHRLYVGSIGTKGLHEVDSASFAVTRTVATGTSPSGIALSPDGSTLYVSDGYDSTISVIDAATLVTTKTILLGYGTSPGRVALSPDGTRLYFINSSVYLYVLDVASGVIAGQVQLAAGGPPYQPVDPVDLIVSPDAKTIYVTLAFTPSVAVVDAEALATSVWIPLATSPYGIALSPDGTRLYVTHGSPWTTFTDNKVSVIDAVSKAVLQTIEVGLAPQRIGKHIGGMEPPSFALTVARDGDGAGTVASATGAINCGTLCAETLWYNTPVTLVATADSESLFTGWKGACTGTDPTCKLFLTGNLTATATFRRNRFLAADYFSVNPGTVWQYRMDDQEDVVRRVLVKTTKVEGVPTFVMHDSWSGLDNYMTSGPGGVFLHGQSQKGVFIPEIGITNVSIAFIPPVKFSDEETGVGKNSLTVGYAKVKAGGRTAQAPFTAHFLVRALSRAVVPAGAFETLELDGTITLADYTIRQNFALAKGLGPVRDFSSDMEGGESLLELLSTNIDSHDLAVTEVVAPKVIAFGRAVTTRTAQVRVAIQNRSPHVETIPDALSLDKAVRLTVESLGPCAVPQPVLQADRLTFPLVLKPKQTLRLTFDVTFSCINDPKRSTVKDPGHHDYRYQARVNHSAIDGREDTHPADDLCPRSVDPPYELDPNPDGAIKDRGCGARKPDRSYGGEILTDIVR